MTKDQILLDLTRSRAALARDSATLRVELDLQAKIKAVVRRRPLAWFGGAAALGWMLAGPRTKTKVVTKFVPASEASGKAGKREVKVSASRPALLAMLIALVKIALPLFKPALTAYAGKQLVELAARLGK